MAYPSLDRLAGHAAGPAGGIPALFGQVDSTNRHIESEALQTIDVWLDELRRATAAEACRVPTERLLRIVFADRRTCWEEIAIFPPQPGVWQRLAELRAAWRICPWWVRWLARRRMSGPPDGRVEYWRVEGAPPPLPRRLDGDQRRVLEAFLSHAPLWRLRTNLWDLFHLPADRRGLAEWIRARSE